MRRTLYLFLVKSQVRHATQVSVVTKLVLVEGEDRACTKASHTNCRKCHKKNKLGCSKFSTKLKHFSGLGSDTSSLRNLWARSLDVMSGGGMGGALWGVGKFRLFFSQATSFEICFDQDQNLSGCQRGSTVNPSF